MVTCRCRTKEHTELLHTALVCRWSKRKTQQVHHGAAWTTGQGNSQRGCHCSLAGCRKLPEAHQRPATERGWGGSPCYLPSTSSKYLQIVIALRSIHTDWSCWQFLTIWRLNLVHVVSNAAQKYKFFSIYFSVYLCMPYLNLCCECWLIRCCKNKRIKLLINPDLTTHGMNKQHILIWTCQIVPFCYDFLLPQRYDKHR